jgi:hypothetical protein
MGPSGTGCLDATLARGTAGGHSIAYTPGLRDAAGRIVLFDVCAQPAAPGRSGTRTVVADEGGQVRVGIPASEDARDAVSCRDAFDDALARAKHCLVHAALRSMPPSYPRDETEYAARCGAPDAPPWRYHAGLPDAAGATRSFALSGERDGASFLLDETGALHVAEGRGATRFDPTPAQRDEAACLEDGDVQRCLARAAALENGALGPDAPQRAAQLYARACAQGDAPSCRTAGALLLEPPDAAVPDPQAMALLERACTLEDRDGCALLAEAKRTQDEGAP